MISPKNVKSITKMIILYLLHVIIPRNIRYCSFQIGSFLLFSFIFRCLENRHCLFFHKVLLAFSSPATALPAMKTFYGFCVQSCSVRIFTYREYS